MQQVVLGIRNKQKARSLLDFLKQLDFIEVKSIDGDTDKKESLEDVLLNAPVLSEDEIDNIGKVGKELNNWRITEF